MAKSGSGFDALDPTSLGYVLPEPSGFLGDAFSIFLYVLTFFLLGCARLQRNSGYCKLEASVTSERRDLEGSDYDQSLARGFDLLHQLFGSSFNNTNLYEATINSEFVQFDTGATHTALPIIPD